MLTHIETTFITGMAIHPFFDSALRRRRVHPRRGLPASLSSYNTLDVRGSRYVDRLQANRSGVPGAPPLQPSRRRCRSSVVGAKRPRSGSTVRALEHSIDNRANYSFDQPYLVTSLDFRPTRRLLVLGAGSTCSQWRQGPAAVRRLRSTKSIRRHASRARRQSDLPSREATVGARLAHPRRVTRARGGFYGVKFHDYHDPDRRSTASSRPTTKRSSTSRSCAIPGCCRCTAGSRRQCSPATRAIPFFMLPALGGGSSLRGFSSWRFRDRNSLLMQGDWRVHRQPLLRHGAVLRRGQGRRATRSDLNFDGPEDGLRASGSAFTAR